jgi:hypothetical protein
MNSSGRISSGRNNGETIGARVASGNGRRNAAAGDTFRLVLFWTQMNLASDDVLFRPGAAPKKEQPEQD